MPDKPDTPDQRRSSTNLLVDEELIEQSTDKIEEETGEFHWMDANGKYQPVSQMSPEELKHAIEFSEEKMVKLHDTILSLHQKMHTWQYRIDRLSEYYYGQESDVSPEAAKQSKELTE